MSYEIRYAPRATADVKALRGFDRTLVRSAIEVHLVQAPTQISKSRIKRMAEPVWCQFRLRVGDFRVYYDVDEDERVVTVLRILRKGSSTTPLEEP